LLLDEMKTLPISNVHMEMLTELSKKNRQKPADYVEELIQVNYNNKKR